MTTGLPSDMSARSAILESVYLNADLAVFVVDVLPDGSYQFVDINPRHEEVTGLSADWIRGRSLDDLRPRLSDRDVQRVRRRYGDCVDSGRPTEYEEELTIDGQTTWWLTRLSPIMGTDDRVARLVGTSLPITRRRELEQQLRSAVEEADAARQDAEQARERAEAAQQRAEAANESKSAFLAGVSHEIRTPLSSILGFIELLQETALTGEQRTFADTIERSARQLRVLLDNVLDLSKAEAGRIEMQNKAFDLHALVGDSVRQLAPDADKQDTRLTYTVGSALPQAVRGDPDRLRQVLLNLLSNAIKFTPNGRVEVRAHRPPHAQPERDSSRFWLRLEVEDTGIGIPPSEQSTIFRAFAQGDASEEILNAGHLSSGVGLGLTITRELVELMDGTIEVESKVGEGATFRVEMPLQADEGGRRRPASRPRESSAAAHEFDGLRVLVAEDEPSHRYLIQRYLERLGIEPDLVETGPEALKRIESTDYDVVLLDVGLPGMTGVEVTEQVRSRPRSRQPRIVAATAQAIEGDRERFLDAGMDGYLPKPFNLSDLVGALRSAMPR
jgi:PAS domain S-box-containing protein